MVGMGESERTVREKGLEITMEGREVGRVEKNGI